MRSIAIAAVLAACCASSPTTAAENHWWRGNTHTHTTLCGHADSTPAGVATWYLDRGYHFLCLSEHNLFIDPATVVLPEPRRQDFLLVPGEEITGAKVHMTALGINALVAFDAAGTATQIIQRNTDRTRAAGGIPIVNHPNYVWGVSAADMRPVQRCYLFELYNGHPHVHNAGDATHPSTEALWDELLDDGMVVYGVSADDAHQFKSLGDAHSNPGRGWVVVRAPTLDSDAICAAMDRGDFYASSGVHLAELTVDGDSYAVRIDAAATEAEFATGTIRPFNPPGAPPAGGRIEFIGPAGAVVSAVDGLAATCPREPGRAWLRAKVTWTRYDAGGVARQCFAWTQPVFEDGRLALVPD
ncbi:MAG: CehA/McbA family metallohydrolase, partial [Planctomycetes bacterium]|nr:CehA/McbA family metallohydrolase [Planctomycetota bacterium]